VHQKQRTPGVGNAYSPHPVQPNVSGFGARANASASARSRAVDVGIGQRDRGRLCRRVVRIPAVVDPRLDRAKRVILRHQRFSSRRCATRTRALHAVAWVQSGFCSPDPVFVIATIDGGPSSPQRAHLSFFTFGGMAA
jgi:hypothetical protein